jgi:SulP family sulfate permease
MGEDLYFIRKGVVRLSIAMDAARVRHLYSCGRGALFGEMTFLGGGVNSTDAIAVTDVELFVLSRKTFNAFAEQHKKAAANLFEGLASVVTTRVRYLTSELVELES